MVDVDATPTVQLSVDVDADSGSMRVVRTQLQALLKHWQVEARIANAVLDVAHELLVNAHQHATPPVRLTVTAGVDEIRVEVSDTGTQPARMLPYRPGLSEHGLGLHLVRQLSLDWGQTSEAEGKTVWAVFVRRPARNAG